MSFHLSARRKAAQFVMAWVGLGLVCTAPVNAAEALRLTWRAPVECETAAEVEARVMRMVATAEGAPAGVRAEAEIARNATTYHLRLAVTSAQGTGVRDIDAEACGPLADAAALIIALAINPNVVPSAAAPVQRASPPAAVEVARAPVRPAKPVEVPAPPTPQPPPPPPPPPAPAPPPPPPLALRPIRTLHPWLLAVRLNAGLDVGTLPKTAGVTGLNVALRKHSWAAEVGALVSQRKDALVPDDVVAKGGAHLRLIAGEARGCWAAVPRDLALWLCVGAEAGVIRGEGFGLYKMSSGVEPWVALSQRVAVRWAVPGARGLAAWAEVGAAIGVVRPRFFLTDFGTLHQPNAVLGRAVVGLEWQWALGNENTASRPL